MLQFFRKVKRILHDANPYNLPSPMALALSTTVAKPEPSQLRLFEIIETEEIKKMVEQQQKKVRELPPIEDAVPLPKKRTQWFREKLAYLEKVDIGKTFPVDKPSEWTAVIKEFHTNNPGAKFTIRRHEDGSYRAHRQA